MLQNQNKNRQENRIDENLVYPCAYLNECYKGDFTKCSNRDYMQNCSKLHKILHKKSAEERRSSEKENLERVYGICSDIHESDIRRIRGYTRLL